MSAMLFRSVADPKHVYAERVRGRRVVYLDTNVWSDLTEGGTDTARHARELAIKTYVEGSAIFPLSYSIITEFLKREENVDSQRQADLMDLLSGGVTFRGPAHIRDLEVLLAFDYMASRELVSRMSEMFTLIPCYISDSRINFPTGWTEQAADDFMAKLRQHGFPGLRFLQQGMRTPTFIDNNEVTDEKYVREISRKRREALDWAADGSGKLNASKLREEEHTFVFKTYVMENLPRLVGLPGMKLIYENLQRVVRKPGRSALRGLVEQMPSTWLSCEMNVQRTLSTRDATEKQNFYDHEHAALALPYTDVFVTSDGGVLDVLRKSRAQERFPCRLLRGIDALRIFLEELASR